MRRWDKELMMNTCSYQCVWDPQGDAVSRCAASVSFQHWEGLCELAYDVQPRWQSLVCNLQSVGARVAEAHAGNTQHVFGPHLFRFVFPMRVLDPQQLRALNRETSHLDDQFCVVSCRRFVYMHRLVRFLFFFFLYLEPLHPGVRILQLQDGVEDDVGVSLGGDVLQGLQHTHHLGKTSNDQTHMPTHEKWQHDTANYFPVFTRVAVRHTCLSCRGCAVWH